MTNNRYLKTFILQRGLSLVELLIAMALGIFLIWGVMQSFLTSRQSYRLQQGVGRIQENGRMAQEFLGFDIRNAGDYGCGSGDDFVWGDFDTRNDTACGTTPFGTAGINMITTVNFATNGFENAVYGFDGDIGGDVDGTTQTITDGTNTVVLGLPTGIFPVANTDVLVVRVSEDVGVLSADVGTFSPAALTDISAATFVLHKGLDTALVANDPVAISDCATTKIFNIGAAAAGATNLSLGSGNYCGYAAFRAGASVRRLRTIYYFIAPSVSGNTTSLYRQMGEGATAEELLEGVADMQLEFGRDTTGGNIIDSWVTANTITGTPAAWSGWDYNSDPDLDPATDDGVKDNDLVRAVRYSLLLVTEDAVLGEAQSLTYNGATMPADGRLRQVFTSSVGIRSRLNPD